MRSITRLLTTSMGDFTEVLLRLWLASRALWRLWSCQKTETAWWLSHPSPSMSTSWDKTGDQIPVFRSSDRRSNPMVVLVPFSIAIGHQVAQSIGRGHWKYCKSLKASGLSYPNPRNPRYDTLCSSIGGCPTYWMAKQML